MAPVKQKGKKSRKLKAVAMLLAVVAVCMSVRFATDYKNNKVQKIVDRLVPKIEAKFGLRIEIADIETSFCFGASITGLEVFGKSSDSPLVEIPKIEIDYRPVISTSPHLKLGAITLQSPTVHLELHKDRSTNLPQELLVALHPKDTMTAGIGGAETSLSLPGGLSKLLEIGDAIQVHWTNAALQVRDEAFSDSTDHRFKRADGQMILDLRSRDIWMDSSFRVQDDDPPARAFIDYSDGGMNVTVQGESVGLQNLASYAPLWLDFSAAKVSGQCKFRLEPGRRPIALRLDGKLRGIILDHWRFADHRVKNIAIDASGVVELDMEHRRIDFPMFYFGRGDAVIGLEGFVQIPQWEDAQIDLRMTCKDMPIQSALKALPPDFIPHLEGAAVEGNLDMNFILAFDMHDLNRLRLEPNIEVRGYRLVESPPKADLKKLHGSFTHTAYKNGEAAKTFVVGPANKDFIKFDDIGYMARRGVLTCEDGRFFRHDGFQLKHIRASLIRNIKEKRFARGGSTITMQTVKNLFLSGTKNVSRKFQEMLLAYAIEQELPKERIFEIYANIIEWGPGIYGIKPAALHYFGKMPGALKPIEAAFLGSIIANPVRYHFMYSRGEVSPRWSVYLQVIVSKMGVGPEAYQEAEPFMPEFGWVRKKRLAAEKEAKKNQEEAGKVSDAPDTP